MQKQRFYALNKQRHVCTNSLQTSQNKKNTLEILVLHAKYLNQDMATVLKYKSTELWDPQKRNVFISDNFSLPQTALVKNTSVQCTNCGVKATL